MNRWLAAWLFLAVVATGCTGAPKLEPEVVESVEQCDDLVPLGAELVRRMLVAVEGASLDVVTGVAAVGPELGSLQAIGRDLDARAARLGCDAAALNTAILGEIGDLTTEDPVGQLFLQVVGEGVLGTLPPVPQTTVTSEAP